MTPRYKLSLLSVVCSAMLLTGCGDATTNIVEKEHTEPTTPDHGHDSDHTIDSLGRLAISSVDNGQVALIDLDDNHLLDQFTTNHVASSITASAGFRYVVVTNREHGHVGFIDGGLWREDHVAHLHDYQQDPALLNYQLTTSQPTHVVKHEHTMAIFNDGDESAGISASVNVLTDNDITMEIADSVAVEFDMNMHGVAQPRGDYLLATVRRDDEQSTSSAKILPDQVAVYHRHDDHFEQESILDVQCPNLHGAAQSLQFVAFGCTDGVLLAKQHDEDFDASKIINLGILNTARIGSLYGHHAHDSLFGVASEHGQPGKLIALDPNNLTMEEIDWQPVENAAATSYAFSTGGEVFVILDNQGFVTSLTAHDHDGTMTWEFNGRVDITEQDVSLMPQDQSFKMTMSQNADVAYISNPIANQILAIDLEAMTVATVTDLDFMPHNLVWLGIEEAHDDH